MAQASISSNLLTGASGVVATHRAGENGNILVLDLFGNIEHTSSWLLSSRSMTSAGSADIGVPLKNAVEQIQKNGGGLLLNFTNATHVNYEIIGDLVGTHQTLKGAFGIYGLDENNHFTKRLRTGRVYDMLPISATKEEAVGKIVPIEAPHRPIPSNENAGFAGQTANL